MVFTVIIRYRTNVKLIMESFILVVWRVYKCNQSINESILQWILINIYFWHWNGIELYVGRHRRLGDRRRYIFVLILFRQFFCIWLLNLRYVGSVHDSQLTERGNQEIKHQGKKDNPLRHFHTFLTLSNVLNIKI